MSFHGPICEGLASLIETAGLHNRAADAPIPPLRGNRGGAKASPLLPFGTRARGLAASGFCIDACELPVLSYLQERGSSLQPFLFIAAISATRRILAIGAQVSEAGESLSPERFREAMIDLAANAGAILAIAAALYLLARRSSTSEQPG